MSGDDVVHIWDIAPAAFPFSTENSDFLFHHYWPGSDVQNVDKPLTKTHRTTTWA